MDDYQRRRWMRPNAHLYIRHDAHRFMPPGSPLYVGRDVVKYFWPEHCDSQTIQGGGHSFDHSPRNLGLERHESVRLKSKIEMLRAEIRLRQLLRESKAGFNPDEPRDDHGRWTDGGSTRVRLAAADKPTFGSAAMTAIFVETAKRTIDAFRSKNGLRDLFGSEVGAVTVTTMNGKDIYGSNSGLPLYKSI